MLAGLIFPSTRSPESDVELVGLCDWVGYWFVRPGKWGAWGSGVVRHHLLGFWWKRGIDELGWDWTGMKIGDPRWWGWKRDVEVGCWRGEIWWDKLQLLWWETGSVGNWLMLIHLLRTPIPVLVFHASYPIGYTLCTLCREEIMQGRSWFPSPQSWGSVFHVELCWLSQIMNPQGRAFGEMRHSWEFKNLWSLPCATQKSHSWTLYHVKSVLWEQQTRFRRPEFETEPDYFTVLQFSSQCFNIILSTESDLQSRDLHIVPTDKTFFTVQPTGISRTPKTYRLMVRNSPLSACFHAIPDDGRHFSIFSLENLEGISSLT